MIEGTPILKLAMGKRLKVKKIRPLSRKIIILKTWYTYHRYTYQYTIGIHTKYILNTSNTKVTKEKVVHFGKDNLGF